MKSHTRHISARRDWWRRKQLWFKRRDCANGENTNVLTKVSTNVYRASTTRSDTGRTKAVNSLQVVTWCQLPLHGIGKYCPIETWHVMPLHVTRNRTLVPADHHKKTQVSPRSFAIRGVDINTAPFSLAHNRRRAKRATSPRNMCACG